MRIGIDIRPLQAETQYRGIGKSLEFTLHAMAKLDLPDSFVFYADDGTPVPAVVQQFPGSRLVLIRAPKLGQRRYFRSFLSSHGRLRPKSTDIDVLWQPDASLGVPKQVPTVTVFYDLIPYLFHGEEQNLRVTGLRWFKNKLAGAVYWHWYLRALKRYALATKLIAISNSSKRDLLAYSPQIPEAAVTVVPLGIDDSFSQVTIASPKIKRLSEHPYILYVGGIDIRKNIVGLLEAFYALKPVYPELRLVLAGKEFELTRQLEDLGWFRVLNSHPDYAFDVVLPGFVSHDDLLYLYHHARCFVLPSRYEGFGLPVLEAMQAGCPVVAYNNSSIPEVAGRAALLVRDGGALKPALERLISDEAERRKLTMAGLKRAALFTWQKTAEQTLAVLRAAAK